MKYVDILELFILERYPPHFAMDPIENVTVEVNDVEQLRNEFDDDQSDGHDSHNDSNNDSDNDDIHIESTTIYTAP